MQPYEPRVDAEGETGLIYIGGTFVYQVGESGNYSGTVTAPGTTRAAESCVYGW